MGNAAAPPAMAKPPRGGGNAALHIARQGWIYAGGTIAANSPDGWVTGQIYAEYQIPVGRVKPFPVIMIHGGGQNGTNFTGTPDGREGWAQYFLRHGYAVYVVDQPGRGRAAYNKDAYGPNTYPSVAALESRFTAPERFGLWPQAVRHRQWPGSGLTGDPVFESFHASQEPGIADFELQQDLMRRAGAALLDRIGPAILLVHSQAGAFAWPIAQARPALVKAIVAIEPNGPPVHNVVMTGGAEWYHDSPETKISGLGDVALAYDPPLRPGEALSFVARNVPASSDRVRCWQQAEPARKLSSLGGIPLLVVTAEASYHAPYDACTVAYLRQAGVPVDHLILAEVGIGGNGHMMMLEKNSTQIAARLVQWLDRRLGPRNAGRR